MINYSTIEEIVEAHKIIAESAVFFGLRLDKLTQSLENEDSDEQIQAFEKEMNFLIGRLRYEETQLNNLEKIASKKRLLERYKKYLGSLPPQ